VSRRFTGAALQVSVAGDELASPALSERWRELAVAAENPFALPDWHGAWVATHPADAPLVLVCREPGGDVAGVVPLVSRGRRLLGAGEQLADWFGPACAPADEARVAAAAVDALARMPQRWDVWQLDRCRAGAWVDGLLAAAAGSAVKLLAQRDEDVLVSVNLPRDGAGLTSAKKRRELARLGRRLREAHAVQLRASTTAPEIERDLEALLRLRAARWSTSFDAPAEAFLRRFTASLAQLGLLRLWATDVDGVPAGVLLGWRLGARMFAYSQAFDREHERFGIGTALLAHAVREAALEGCEHFDMLRGDESFKASFHISPSPVTSYHVVRRRSRALLEEHAIAGARAVYGRLSPQRRERLRRALGR
jgi:CelD/BcsL family acetyltransferase involved in cellulose biosynthesis